MKKVLLGLVVLGFIACEKQSAEKYIITGNVQGIADSTVIDLYMKFYSMGSRVHSDTIINGHFEFSDTLESRPSRMELRIQDFEKYSGACDLWVDHTTIQVEGQGKFLSAWNAKSQVKEQIELNRFNHATKELDVILDSLILMQSQSRGDWEIYNQIRPKIDSIYNLSKMIQFELIKQNPNSETAVELLYYFAKNDTTISNEEIENLYQTINPIYKTSLYAEGIASIISRISAPKIGDKIVDFEVSSLEGEKSKLSDYEGKYILLDFWSMACYPCILAAPELRELNANYKDSLTIIGISIDTNKEFWKKGSERDSITWINLSDGKGLFAGAAFKYEIQGFPTYFLINPEGIIVEKWTGFTDGIFKKKLSKYFPEMANQ